MTWDLVFNQGHHFKIQPKPRNDSLDGIQIWWSWGWYQALSKETLEFRGFPTTILNLLVVIPKLYRHIEPDKSSWTSRHLCMPMMACQHWKSKGNTFLLSESYLLFQSSTLIHFDSPWLQTIPQAVIAPGHSLGCLQAIPAAHNGNSSYASRVVLGWSEHPAMKCFQPYCQFSQGKASWKHHLAWSAPLRVLPWIDQIIVDSLIKKATLIRKIYNSYTHTRCKSKLYASIDPKQVNMSHSASKL